VPYGVYDLATNAGWVSVGVDHDTAAFAVNSIRQWWLNLRRARYPDATRMLITADGGGSNGSRVRLWKRELQKLANELGLNIVVSHLPPGTSKWNKIKASPFLLHQPELACPAPRQPMGEISAFAVRVSSRAGRQRSSPGNLSGSAKRAADRGCRDRRNSGAQPVPLHSCVYPVRQERPA
jgi:hypothetical protein